MWSPSSTHSFQFISPLVVDANAKQYVWTDTTGLSNLQLTSSLNVPYHGSITGNYKTQYYLTMLANFGTTSPALGGSNWYDSGSLVTISATAPPVGAGERFVWGGWVGSGTGGSYTGNDNPATNAVTMSGPVTQTASWTHQYQLTISGNVGGVSPASGSWYTAGSQVVIQATAPSVVSGERYLWNGWTGGGSGSYSGTNNPTTGSEVTMNAPVTETASWTHQYLVTFDQSGLNSDASGTVVTVGGVDKTFNNLPFTMWVDASTGSVTYSYTNLVSSSIAGKQYAKTSSDSSPVTGLSGPVTVTGTYKIQYQVTFSQTGVDSSAGSNTVLTVGASNYAYNALPTGVWVDSGTIFIWASPVSGGSGKQFVQTGSLGSSPIQAAGTYTATYKTQYLVAVLTNPAGLTPQPSRNPVGDAGPAGSWWYDASGSVELTAQSVSGYIFDHWVIDSISQGSGANPVTISISSVAHSATAFYTVAAGETYQVTFNAPTSPALTDVSSTTAALTVTIGAGSPITVTNGEFPKVISGITTGTSVSFSYLSPIASTTVGKQYNWLSTSGTGSASAQTGQTGSFTLTADSTVVAAYKTQYYLTVTSAYGVASGAGWYDSGSTPTAGVSAGTVSGGAGTQYVFTSWGTDASGTTYSASNPITMNSPKTATAGWNTEYMLTVNSLHGSPTGAGWYGSGVTANFGVSSPDGASGTRYVFTAWSGDSTSTSPSASISMNGPKTVTAGWKTQYQATFNQAGLNNDATGTVLTVGATTYTYGQLPQTGIWVDDGTTYSYTPTVTSSVTGKQYISTSVTGGLTTPIHASGSTTGNYKTQWQVTFTVSPPGAGSTSPSGTDWYDDAFIIDPLSATQNTGFTFASWSSNTGSIVFGSSDSSSTTARIGGAGTITANFVPTFVVPEYSFGALAALGACFIAMLIYKRKNLPHFTKR